MHSYENKKVCIMTALATTTSPIYMRVGSVSEALEMAARHSDDFSYLAGGTDVMVNRFQGNNPASCLIDLSGIAELQNVSEEADWLRIGALVKLNRLKNYPPITEYFPVLIEAARAVGSPLVRSMATLGGNLLCENRCIFYNQTEFGREAVNYCLKSGGDICIATGGPKVCFSEFVSDTAPALISLDARVEIAAPGGGKTIPLEEIYTGDGLQPRKLEKTAILKTILLPLNRCFRSVFKKLSPRKSVDFTSLTTAVSVDDNGKMKVVLGGVSPGPVVIEWQRNGDPEALIKQALKLCKTVDNDVYSRNYRRKMISVFLSESLEQL